MAETNPVIHEGVDAFAVALAEALGSISSSLDIYSHNLPREIFGTSLVVNSLRSWIINQPRAKVRVFVHNAHSAMFRGNGLIELGLQLTSFFQFHEPAKAMPMLFEHAIIDNKILVRRSTSNPQQVETWSGVDQNIPVAQREFENYWTHSKPSLNIRNLNL